MSLSLQTVTLNYLHVWNSMHFNESVTTDGDIKLPACVEQYAL